MTVPSASDWVYSGKAFLAAMLAFYLALVIPLPNPYWAVASVYIVSHPLSGATRSKGMYRALGTLMGAAVALLLVPPLASRPLTLVLAIGAWSALSLYLSLRDNKPSAYSFLLAAYTTPLVAVSAIVAPGTIFDTALARSEEILLGVACASIVSAVLFPSRVSPVFDERVTALMKDAGAWAVRRLTDPARRATPPLRFHLLSDIVALDALITHLGYDATRRSQARVARRIRFRMTMLIPQVASLGDALHGLREAHAHGMAPWDAHVRHVIDWLKEGTDGEPARGHVLRDGIVSSEDAAMHASSVSLDAVNAAERLRDVIDLWQDCLVLHRAFRDERETGALAYRAPVPDDRSRHYDHAMMAYAAISPALAFVVAGWAWLWSGWPGGASGVIFVAVGTAFFAASDAPAPLVGRFLLWESISIAVALVYLFYVLPQVTTFVGVVLALAPPLLVVGTFTGRPSFNMGVLLLTSQTLSDIGLRNGAAANFEDFANGSLGTFLGLAFAVLWSAIVRPFGTEIAVRRLARANWRDQIALVTGDLRADRQAALSRIADRTTQWMPRLALVSGERLADMDAVRDLRVCMALMDLRLHRPLDTSGAAFVDRVFAASHMYFTDCLAEERTLPLPHDLLAALADGMASLPAGQADAASALLRYRLALLSLPRAVEPASPPVPDQPLPSLPS